MRYIFYILGITIASTCQAFNWRSCEREWIDKSTWLGEGLFISTSSFVSSTGECSMIGMKEHDSKVFFVQNVDNIYKNLAMGNGDYLIQFATYFCEKLDETKLYENVKNEVYILHYNSLKNSYEQIKDLIHNSQKNSECKIKS